MVFNSSSFLVFFPIVVLVYFVFPPKRQWIWLLVSSYYFYLSWNIKYGVLLLTTTIITWLGGMFLEQYKGVKWIRQGCVGICLVVDLAILGIFKYQDFVLDSIIEIANRFGVSLSFDNRLDVLLPVGISFYTFQALGYVIDVYRGEKAEHNFFRYALFLSFFPQLVAGPIERSKNLLGQLRQTHAFDYRRVKNGLLLMLWGLFQKMIIADRVALLVNTVYNNYGNYHGIFIVIATVFFAIQIYCDFGGYSDIAIGASQVMGIDLMQNFNKPYFAVSVKDFWQRWHISLTAWLRDYLYIPLGGNRKGKVRKYINTMIVFLTSGIWHGANWTYVIWGGGAWCIYDTRGSNGRMA
ncbi:MAG: MBOAT family O-acyltransferase [Roseburia sp.]